MNDLTHLGAGTGLQIRYGYEAASPQDTPHPSTGVPVAVCAVSCKQSANGIFKPSRAGDGRVYIGYGYSRMGWRDVPAALRLMMMKMIVRHRPTDWAWRAGEKEKGFRPRYRRHGNAKQERSIPAQKPIPRCSPTQVW